MKSESGEKRCSTSRSYSLGQRQVAADVKRAKIVTTARRLLASGRGAAAFSMDAVARRAGVARMTVYHQFGSKRDLLEALFDDLAARGLVTSLRPAFAEADPLRALAKLIAAFAAFWTSDRKAIRCIRAMAALDPDFEQALHERDERRRRGIREILGRFENLPRHSLEEAINLVWTLTSFETFDSLAGPRARPSDVVSLVQGAVLATLGFDDDPAPAATKTGHGVSSISRPKKTNR
jgi:AcrR family transcriptional regulator